MHTYKSGDDMNLLHMRQAFEVAKSAVCADLSAAVDDANALLAASFAAVVAVFVEDIRLLILV